MITGPLFKWFGSKWSASKHYPAPKHDCIFEPFAGSAGYSLRHAHERPVMLAESNERLYHLWRWLIEEATEASIREIPLNLPIGTDIRTIGLTYGQQLLLKNWQRTNNLSECWTVSKWGNLSGQWTENTRSRVASEFHHVKSWELVADGFDLMERTPHSATWFVDPPYLFNYRYGSSSFDHWQLACAVRKLHGQVIVCEAACPKTGEFPNWLPFVDFRRTVTSRRKQTENHHSRELVYLRDS